MKGLVSFTLFGDLPLYNVGAVKNVQIWNESEFDIHCRFYVGESVPRETRGLLSDLGAEVIPVDLAEDQTATFWRYDALQNCRYDYILFRDVDSRPFEREFYCIRQWLRDGLANHVIRDHPFHAVPLLAGLFGVKSDEFQNIGRQLKGTVPEDFYKLVNRAQRELDYASNDFYQVDQWWLRLRVYPYMHNMISAHDAFFNFERHRFQMGLPHRQNNEFCGEGFTENDESRYPEHRAKIALWEENLGVRGPR